MSRSRTIIGFSVAGIILTCLYMEYLNFLFVAINGAVIYDTYYLYKKLAVNTYIVLAFFLSTIMFNTYLMLVYYQDPYFVLKIAFISQMSDVYQFIAGRTWGYNKIGWISQNKSYEGYIIGYLLTIITFVPVLLVMSTTTTSSTSSLTFIESVTDCTTIYIYGIIGGLISSGLKRTIGIKDYSDLLGTHGGWIDRIDSIILPIVIMHG